MTALTQAEKASIFNIIGLVFTKEENKIKVVLAESSPLITPYSYENLAMIIVAKLNTIGSQEIYRLRKILKKNNPHEQQLKIVHILQIGSYFKYT